MCHKLCHREQRHVNTSGVGISCSAPPIYLTICPPNNHTYLSLQSVRHLIMSNDKPCIIEGVLNDEQSTPTNNSISSNPQESSTALPPPPVASAGEGGLNGPTNSSGPSPARTAARRRPRRTMSIEDLTRTVSNSSLGSLVTAYLRRNISKPKMAKREGMFRDISGRRSRRSVAGSVAEEDEDDTDDTDALYI